MTTDTQNLAKALKIAKFERDLDELLAPLSLDERERLLRWALDHIVPGSRNLRLRPLGDRILNPPQK